VKCNDADATCQGAAVQGFCEQSEAFMAANCPVSCLVCDASTGFTIVSTQVLATPITFSGANEGTVAIELEKCDALV
jgi:hypothetical protein